MHITIKVAPQQTHIRNKFIRYQHDHNWLKLLADQKCALQSESWAKVFKRFNQIKNN